MTYAKKSLGQHFLPPSFCEKMVGRLHLDPTDRVLEIGSGPGALTTALLPRVAQLVSVEIDGRFAETGRELAARHPHFTFVEGDFLELSLRDILGGGRWKVVANIPYYITTPILEKLLGEERPFFSDLYLLVQTEVAERMVAEGARQSGSLTFYVTYWTEPRIVLNVAGRVFQPPAKVDSSMVHLAVRPAPAVASDHERLFSIIHAAFTQRRKMLRSSLRSIYGEAALATAFQAAGVDPAARPEALHLADFARLTDALA